MLTNIIFSLLFTSQSHPVPCTHAIDTTRFKYFTQYNTYLHKYNKSYPVTQTYWEHYYIFEKNIDKINDHNKKNLSWSMGLNNFTDISFEEFKSVYLGTKMPRINKKFNIYKNSPKGELPSSIDWRSENLVTHVKDQGPCGSCWAFSAVGSIEGAHSKKTGNLTSLSEQNLVDCANTFDCDGCGGGWMNNAMEYVHYNDGIDTESSYPYTATDGKCKYQKNFAGATVKSVVNITKGDSDSLLNAVGSVGPISVAIDAEGDFQMYSSGIYSSTTCSKEYLDHGVLVVGYGVTSKGKKYYIIKNSWGNNWGMDGYIYWDRDIDNMCGIAQAASFPEV